MSPVDAWYATDRALSAALDRIRAVLLDLGLEETLKWRHPCYTVDGRNVVIMGLRGDDCVVSYFNGALLDDPTGALQSAGPNTRAARILRFAGLGAVEAGEPVLRALTEAAIDNARAGRRVVLETPDEDRPPELTDTLEADPALADAFEALTAGRRRGFLLHFNSAKRPSTRHKRIEAARERIMAGKGIHDCVCGRSKRMPRCDGSHRDA